MNLVRLYFLLFILKQSAKTGFWYQLRVTDKPTSKKVITVERTHKRFEKLKLDINFLVKCQKSNLYPIFIKGKHLQDMNKKVHNRYYRCLLLDEISNKHKQLK